VQVQTIRGPIDTRALGRVLIHEHIFLMNMEYTYNYRPDFFEEETIAKAAARLNGLKAAGFDTIIDLTVLGLGRHIPSLAKVALQTGINIIVSTGAYTFNDVPAPFSFYGPGLLCDAAEPMVEHFVRDIVEGLTGTGIKAGELKCYSTSRTTGVNVPVTTRIHAVRLPRVWVNPIHSPKDADRVSPSATIRKTTFRRRVGTPGSSPSSS
jgi:predicted metal-dependent phosphotriesterase family hydrolase